MLTRREAEASAVLAEGCGRAELAERLSVSVSAADKLVRSLKMKMGAGNRSELALRCRERAEGAHLHTPMRERIATVPNRARSGGNFSDAKTIDDLFGRLLAALRPFGVTDVAYSHIRRDNNGVIEHLASRWSFPPEVTFDYSIPANENPAFKSAMSDWTPMPLDLEAMMASDFYSYVPNAIRRQNDVFVAAGMVRGVTFALPGLSVRDRLVLSALLRHADPQRFGRFLEGDLGRVQILVTAFRNAHVDMAKPRLSLTEREATTLRHLAEGRSIDEAAEAQGISRRAADRALEGARSATGRAHNAGAVAAWLQDRAEPALPF